MSLSFKSQHLSKTAWYYEDELGIDIVVEHRSVLGELIGGTPLRVLIPWAKLEASVFRKQEDRAQRAGRVVKGTRVKRKRRAKAEGRVGEGRAK